MKSKTLLAEFIVSLLFTLVSSIVNVVLYFKFHDSSLLIATVGIYLLTMFEILADIFKHSHNTGLVLMYKSLVMSFTAIFLSQGSFDVDLVLIGESLAAVLLFLCMLAKEMKKFSIFIIVIVVFSGLLYLLYKTKVIVYSNYMTVQKLFMATCCFFIILFCIIKLIFDYHCEKGEDEENYDSFIEYLNEKKAKKHFAIRNYILDSYLVLTYIRKGEYDNASNILKNTKWNILTRQYMSPYKIMLDLYYGNLDKAKEENDKFKKVLTIDYDNEHKLCNELIKIADKKSFDEKIVSKCNLPIINEIIVKYSL